MTNRDLILHLVYKASLDADTPGAAENGALLAALYLHGTDEEIDDLVATLKKEMPEIFPS